MSSNHSFFPPPQHPITTSSSMLLSSMRPLDQPVIHNGVHIEAPQTRNPQSMDATSQPQPSHRGFTFNRRDTDVSYAMSLGHGIDDTSSLMSDLPDRSIGRMRSEYVYKNAANEKDSSIAESFRVVAETYRSGLSASGDSETYRSGLSATGGDTMFTDPYRGIYSSLQHLKPELI